MRDLSVGRTTGLVVVDQAEDIRRAIWVHATEHLADIDIALGRTNMVIAAVPGRSASPTLIAGSCASSGQLLKRSDVGAVPRPE